jgi:hypothetical protein
MRKVGCTHPTLDSLLTQRMTKGVDSMGLPRLDYVDGSQRQWKERMLHPEIHSSRFHRTQYDKWEMDCRAPFGDTQGKSLAMTMGEVGGLHPPTRLTGFPAYYPSPLIPVSCTGQALSPKGRGNTYSQLCN